MIISISVLLFYASWTDNIITIIVLRLLKWKYLYYYYCSLLPLETILSLPLLLSPRSTIDRLTSTSHSQALYIRCYSYMNSSIPFRIVNGCYLACCNNGCCLACYNNGCYLVFHNNGCHLPCCNKGCCLACYTNGCYLAFNNNGCYLAFTVIITNHSQALCSSRYSYMNRV